MVEILYSIALACAGAILLSYYVIRKRGGEKIENKYTKDGRINQQYLAEKIAELEGKKIEINIGQIKEILKNTLGILAIEYTEDDVLRLLKKYK